MPPNSKYKILLVEDEPMLAFTETLLLQKQGYEVEHVLTGESAVEKVQTDTEIDLILMDIDLGPGIDGTEASKLILSKNEIPIVFLTSHSEKEMVAKVKEITRYGLVTKSAGPFVLFSTIEMALDLFRTKQELSRLEQRWNAALQVTDMGVWEYDTVLQRVFVSEQIKQISGRFTTSSDIALSEWESWIYPDDRELVLFLLNQFINGYDEQFSISYRLTHKEGYSLWVKHAGASLKRSAEGKVLRMIATVSVLDESYFQNEKLTKIAQHIPGVIYQYRVRKDGSSHFPYASEGILDIYSVNPEDVIEDASPVFSVIHPDDLKPVADSIEESKANQTVWKKKYRVKKNGTYVWVEGESTPEVLSDGSVLWHGYIRSIDEFAQISTDQEKKSELILLNSLQLEFEKAPIPVFIVEKSGKVHYANKAVAKLLHYEQSELIQKPIVDLIVSNTEYNKQFKKMLQLPQYSSTIQLRRKEGSTVAIQYNSFKFNEDIYIGFIHEIDELVKIATELQLQKEYFEGILDALPINVYRINRLGEVIYANKFYQLNSGLTEKEIIGKTAYDFYPVEDADKYWRDDQKVFKTKKVLKTIERNVVPGNKKETFVQVVKQPILSSDGKVTGIVGIFYDITQTVEEEKAKDLLIEHQNTLIVEVHHRIKNNLAMIVGMMQLQADFTTDLSVKHSLLAAAAKIAVISTMYNKLYQSKGTDRIELSDYLLSLENDIEKTILPDSIKLKIQVQNCLISEKKALIVGICITEFVTNSIKYAFPNSPKNAEIIIKAALNENKLQLLVSDNGIGIPENVRNRNQSGFGYTMIDSLTKQIQAHWEFDPASLSTVCITVPIP